MRVGGLLQGRLSRLGIGPPYRWIAGMEGMRGRPLLIAGQGPTFPKPGAAADIVERDGAFSGKNEEANAALESFFAAVFGNHHMVYRRGS